MKYTRISGEGQLLRWLSVLCSFALVVAGILGGNNPVLDAHWAGVFPTIDTDGDTFVGKEELRQYMQRGHHMMSRAHRDRLVAHIKGMLFAEFAVADVDGDGFLTTAENTKARESVVASKCGQIHIC
jgi:hypothetical protein